MSGKRLFDIVAAATGLMLTSPLSAIAAIAVRSESPGSILFVQNRVGLDGSEIKVHKFRTMRTCVVGPTITQQRDPRITRTGAFLRKTKIDELPQLWDVLVGRMSIVGPRPEMREYVEQWPDDLRPLILSVRPGITDPATVLLRNEQELLARQADPLRFYADVLLPQKAQMYADYVRDRTFCGDIRLIARTVRAVANA